MKRRLEEVKNAHEQAYADKVNKDDYAHHDDQNVKVKRFEIAGDDTTYRHKMWDSLATDCAFYYDEPYLQQEITMKKKLQYRYDSLFPEGWRPSMQSRNDLMSWACIHQNNFMKEKGASEDMMWNCENPRAMIDKHGPNYDSLRAKLGYIKGLYRE